MTDEEFYNHFEAMKTGDQQKVMMKLGKMFNKKFQEAMQRVMHE